MPIVDISVLKNYFQQGKVPTESEYVDLIDTLNVVGTPYTHPNHSGEVTSVGDGAQTITADAVTNTKLANMAVNTIKGRITAGTGDPEDLSQANVRTIIGAGSGNGLDADKLDGYHAGSASGQIPISDAVHNVNLNADYLDGYHAGNDSGLIPISNTNLNTNLNADMLDNYHAANFARFSQIMGTSFPGSPTNGDMFFRTDLGWLCYWNGTYWLTAHEYEASWMTGQSFTITGGSTDIHPLRSDYRFWITRYSFRVNANAPQDSSNYYNIALRSINSTFTAAAAYASFNTQALTTGAWNVAEAAVGATHATYIYWLDWTANKIGSPGNILVVGTIYYRLIVT